MADSNQYNQYCFSVRIMCKYLFFFIEVTSSDTLETFDLCYPDVLHLDNKRLGDTLY